MSLKSFLDKSLKKMQMRLKDNRMCAICVFPEETFFVWTKVDPLGRMIEPLQFERFSGSRQVAFKELKNWVSVHRFKSAHCAIVLPPGSYRMLLMDELNVEPEEKYDAIQWVCKDLVTESIDLMALDTFPITVKSGNDPKIYIVMSSKAELAALRDEVHDIGLVVTHIDIADFALASWFSKINKEQVALLFGRYQLTIIENGEIRMSRKLGDWGEPLSQVNIPELVTELEVSLRFYLEQFSNTPPEKLYTSASLFTDELMQPVFLEKFPLPVEKIDKDFLNSNTKVSQNPEELGAIICEGLMHRWIKQVQLEIGSGDETDD